MLLSILDVKTNLFPMISALLINTMDKLPKIPLEYLTIKMNTILELMLLMIPKN